MPSQELCVDPLVAVGIGLWVLPRTWSLLKDSVNILLEGAPEGIEVEAVGRSMCEVPGVMSVHDLHVWALTSGKPSLMAHVVHAPGRSTEGDLLPASQKRLAKSFKLFRTTLQFETKPCMHTEDGCNYVERPPSGHGDDAHDHIVSPRSR